MDSPDKKQISATSLSKFENSPVFNYINSLSPIEPVKSVHTDHTFNSLTLASPSSLFTSPQISSLRESRFSLRRHQCLDPSKSEVPLSGNENNTNEAVSEGVQVSDIGAERVECFTPGSSNREVTTELELPQTLKYDSGSPDSNMVPHNLTDTGSGMLGTLASPVESNKDDFKERQHLFERELHLRKICRIQQNEQVAGCDWVTLITNVADLLTSNSSITEDNIEEKDKKSVDPGTISFISTVLQLPQDNADDLENMESVDPGGSSKQSEMMGQVTQSGEIGDMNETDQTPAILSSNLLDKLVVSDTSEKVDNEQQQQRIRRRCLVFEMAGAHTRKSACDSNCSSSTSLPSDCKVAYIEKHLVPSKIGSNYLSSMLPGIGLPLNELATTSNDVQVCKGETLASGMQLTSIPGSISSSDSCPSDQNPLNNYLISNSIERNVVLGDSENIVIENAPQTSAGVVGNESDYSSPKKKRHKSESAGGSEACKRCNCRRSKCLKLYCECFAAGLYCVEPCSCIDCFNKPVHEDIVLETRRQIESRNPIAFAPKVIRSTESVPEFGEETNKTPASARHKRGCNCKKSSCLKKYCECFQGGVGCSFSCRCEGCKNTFGQKDGAYETEFEGEDAEAEKNELEVSSHDIVLKKDKEKHPDLSIIPSEIARPTIQTFTFDGKLPGCSLHAEPSPQSCASRKIQISELFGSHSQPRFKAYLQAIPEDETPEVLNGNCSPSSVVKAASPNSKRVSPPQPEMRSSAALHSSRKLVLRSVPRFPSLNPP